jgi:hypothetical protein
MAQQRKEVRSRLSRIMESYRQAWLKAERARHEEFIQALRDPYRAPTVLDTARQELQDWKDQGSRAVDDIGGWQTLLALPPDTIATILEEQSHPLLRQTWKESPFTRPWTEEEVETSRQRTLDRLLHRKEFALRKHS